MSPRLRREPFAADHTRARELAAQRVDGPIGPDDAGWLNDHLAWCGPCRAVAAEYDEQRLALRALRFDEPVPPRDLWARTAAKIEVEPSRRRPASRGRRTGFGVYASLTGALIVALVAGTVVIDRVLPPLDNTTKGDEPIPTPIDLVAGEIQVLSHAADGSLEIQSKYLDQLCPVGRRDVRPAEHARRDQARQPRLGRPGRRDRVAGPRPAGRRRARLLREHGLRPAARSTPGPPRTRPRARPRRRAPRRPRRPSSRPRPRRPPRTRPVRPTRRSRAHGVARRDRGPVGDASGSPDASASASPGPDATDEPATSEPASAEPTDTAAPSEAPTPEPTPDATPEATAEATEPPPSIEVTPRPDGAIEIASDVVIVGSAAGYSPDGTRFAFSARPADGSAGPDVYVWRVGDRKAKAVTAEHDAQLAGWIGDRLLVSRVVDGEPSTAILDLADDTERLAGDGAMWRPTMGPERKVAAWWDGTVRLADDGMTWVPDRGRLVLGDWPNGGADAQVLAERGVTDWDVQWDEAGTRLAVWVVARRPRRGRPAQPVRRRPGHRPRRPRPPDCSTRPRRTRDSRSIRAGSPGPRRPMAATRASRSWPGTATSVGTVSLPADDDTTILR